MGGATLPDSQMQALLRNARKCSGADDQQEDNIKAGYNGYSKNDFVGTDPADHHNCKPGGQSSNMGAPYRRSPLRMSADSNEMVNRKLSEAGVNRRASAALVLNADTESFIIGDRVFVDGVKPGRIQFIGETRFGPGDDWAGVFLDEPIGKNDGSVGGTRYFTCEPKHGVFSKLYRLTREPIEGATEALHQIRKYGYELVPDDGGGGPIARRVRKDSTNSSGGRGSRRGSGNYDNVHLHHQDCLQRRSMERYSSTSPYNRGATPDNLVGGGASRYSPESHSSGSGSGSYGYGGTSAVRKSSGPSRIARSAGNTSSRPLPLGSSPMRGLMPQDSSFGLSRSFAGDDVKIDKDPDLTRLTSEARRLSMGGSARRTDQLSETLENNSRNSMSPAPGANGRRESGGGARRPDGQGMPPVFSRKTSESLGLGSSHLYGSPNRSRSGSESEPYRSRKGSAASNLDDFERKPSSELSASDLQKRRLSEAGMRRPSHTEKVLNDDTSNLQVGMMVFVDGTKRGRIAYIGEVHFAKGEVAGIHLDQPIGKNNGTVGGKMYFQTEPKRGIFSRLHRLTLRPMIIESDEDEN